MFLCSLCHVCGVYGQEPSWSRRMLAFALHLGRAPCCRYRLLKKLKHVCHRPPFNVLKISKPKTCPSSSSLFFVSISFISSYFGECSWMTFVEARAAHCQTSSTITNVIRHGAPRIRLRNGISNHNSWWLRSDSRYRYHMRHQLSYWSGLCSKIHRPFVYFFSIQTFSIFWDRVLSGILYDYYCKYMWCFVGCIFRIALFSQRIWTITPNHLYNNKLQIIIISVPDLW